MHAHVHEQTYIHHIYVHVYFGVHTHKPKVLLQHVNTSIQGRKKWDGMGWMGHGLRSEVTRGRTVCGTFCARDDRYCEGGRSYVPSLDKCHAMALFGKLAHRPTEVAFVASAFQQFTPLYLALKYLA